MESDLSKSFLAEAFGCCILVFFACGSSIQFIFMKFYSPGDNNLVLVYLSNAFAPTMAIIFTAKISGTVTSRGNRHQTDDSKSRVFFQVLI